MKGLERKANHGLPPLLAARERVLRGQQVVRLCCVGMSCILVTQPVKIPSQEGGASDRSGVDNSCRPGGFEMLEAAHQG